MSSLEILWHLNMNDKTKYLLILGGFVLVILCCVLNVKKKSKKSKKRKNKKIMNDNFYTGYKMMNNPTKCQQDYIKCVENKTNGIGNQFCYPCQYDGTYPDTMYDPVMKQYVYLK
jgi:hypothetical protein